MTASVRSRIPVDWVEIVQGGRTVAKVENPSGNRDVTLKDRVRVKDSSWIAARAKGPELVYQGGIPLVAHTSPIYLQVGGRKPRSPEDAAFFLTWIDEAMTWLEETANIPDPDQRREMKDLFEAGQGNLRRDEGRRLNGAVRSGSGVIPGAVLTTSHYQKNRLAASSLQARVRSHSPHSAKRAKGGTSVRRTEPGRPASELRVRTTLERGRQE